MTPTITHADAGEYFTLHHEQAKAEKRLKELKAIILPAILAGATSPPEYPFLLVNRPQQRPSPDWKGYALKLATKLFKTKVKAEAELKAVDAAWPEKTIDALHVVANPDFKS